jgi:hypothetical protein
MTKREEERTRERNDEMMDKYEIWSSNTGERRKDLRYGGDKEEEGKQIILPIICDR